MLSCPSNDTIVDFLEEEKQRSLRTDSYRKRLKATYDRLVNVEYDMFRGEHRLFPACSSLEYIHLLTALRSPNEHITPSSCAEDTCEGRIRWTLRFASFGQNGDKYKLELEASAANTNQFDWYVDALLRVSIGGKVLRPHVRPVRPVHFSSSMRSVCLFAADIPMIRALPSGIAEVEVSIVKDGTVFSEPLFGPRTRDANVVLHVTHGNSGRFFYVNREWLSGKSAYFRDVFREVEPFGMCSVPDMAPRSFIVLLRALEHFVDHELNNRSSIEMLIPLAERFEIPSLRGQLVRVLFSTRQMTLDEKLLLADKHLSRDIVHSVFVRCDVFILYNSYIYQDLSPDLKTAVENEYHRQMAQQQMACPRTSQTSL